MAARISLGIFFLLGLAMVAFSRAIQGHAVKAYEENGAWFKSDMMRKWIASESYVWSVRGIGVLLMIAVIGAIVAKFSDFRGW